MVTLAEATATAEIGTSPTRTVLLEDAIDPAPLQFGQQEERREERVADQHTTGFQSIKQAAQQRLLVIALAVIRAGRCVQHGTAG
jgi:hypothetical protein